MTNQEIKTVGQTIAAETQIGGNTAERVGGVIEGIGEALDNKDAAVGYYLATMSGSTIYINASSYRLGTGGNLRAKMPAAATTACTLTVGNANAVQLWYNGAAVSADNSWEAGEIVTIFYDGTRFMASNSQGGGGQFGSGEKIKDILLSQVLGAGTAAITSQKGVSDAIFNEIDISSIDTLKTLNDALAPSSSLKPTYYTVTAMLSSVKLKVGSMAVISDNMRHVVTEIMATHYLLDDAGNLTNEHSDAEIFFIYRSVKLSGGTLPDPAGTWTKWRYVNSSVWSTAAEKIKYDNTTSGLAAENVQDALDEVGDTLFELSEKAIAMGTSTKYYYTYENGVIGTVGHNNFRLWQPVDISEFYALSIKFYLPATFAGKSFFTKEIDGTDVMVGDFLVNQEYEEKNYIVPEGATKLYFCVYYKDHTSISVKGIKRKGLDDKVEQLEEGLKDTNENTVLDKVTFYNPYSSTQYGYVKEDGSIATGSSSSPYRYTGYIEVEEDNVIYIHANFVVTAVAVLAAYDSENTFIQGSSIMADGSGSQDIIYKVPAGVSYLRLSASTSDNTWKAEKGISVKNVLADGLHGVIEYTPEHGAGDAYLQLDGTYVADGHHNWKITYPFNVLEGDEVFFQTTNNSSTGMVGAYTDESLMVASSVVAGSDQNSKMWYKYTVPQGVKWIRLSHKYSVDGDITVYIRRKIEKMPKKSISVLFIGNSITQDTVTYVPLLLRELAPELDFHFYIWYNGGFTLDEHLAYFNNNTPCYTFSRCSNSPSWKNFQESVTMSSILSTYTFDIVQIQEYCHYKDTDELVDASVETFNEIIEYIEDHYDKPFKVATLYHKTLLDHDNRATAPQVFERTRAIISRYLKDTVTELLNPAGISMYRAMAVPELDELGDQGHLSPDARHAQEGLPCMMEAYVTAMWLLNILGIPMSVVNSKTVVNNNNYEAIGVPGANLGTGVVIGTEEQVRLSQKVAIKAFKEGEYFVNANLTEYTT